MYAIPVRVVGVSITSRIPNPSSDKNVELFFQPMETDSPSNRDPVRSVVVLPGHGPQANPNSPSKRALVNLDVLPKYGSQAGRVQPPPGLEQQSYIGLQVRDRFFGRSGRSIR